MRFYHREIRLTAATACLSITAMHIGMMLDAYKPYVSGVTNHVEINKKYLEAAGHAVYIFTFGEAEKKEDEPRVIRSPGLPIANTGFYLSLRYSRQAKQILQSMDVVHVHHPFLSGRLAMHYCHPLSIPLVYTNHTRYDLYAQAYMPMMPEEISFGMLQTYMPAFCEDMDLVISPSAGMAKVLRGLNVKTPIEIVPNGVEMKRFLKADPLPRANFGFQNEDLLLIYAGRIAPEKNLPLLLRAFAGVLQAVPQAKLLIVGNAIQKSYEEEIKKLAGDLKINDHIRFTGRIPYENLPGYLAMCDIFVTASITEVHPLSVIEAMGVGLPVMGIHSVGVGDTVEDGVTGYLSTNDEAGFAAKLTRLCLDPGLRANMRIAARRASAQYDIESITQIMLGHYQRLVENSKPKENAIRVRMRGFLERIRL